MVDIEERLRWGYEIDPADIELDYNQVLGKGASGIVHKGNLNSLPDK